MFPNHGVDGKAPLMPEFLSERNGFNIYQGILRFRYREKSSNLIRAEFCFNPSFGIDFLLGSAKERCHLDAIEICANPPDFSKNGHLEIYFKPSEYNPSPNIYNENPWLLEKMSIGEGYDSVSLLIKDFDHLVEIVKTSYTSPDIKRILKFERKDKNGPIRCLDLEKILGLRKKLSLKRFLVK